LAIRTKEGKCTFSDLHVFILQYASIIFYHDGEQKKLAEETLKEEAKKYSDPVLTKILPATTFHDAEEYVLPLYDENSFDLDHMSGGLLSWV
jgi:peptide methionine sulfoxide reductase MsrA